MKVLLSITFILLCFSPLYSQYWYVFDNKDTLYNNGYNANINCFYNDGDSVLYVGGDFKKGGTTLLNSIGLWNGQCWQGLGPGLSTTYTVDCIQKYNGKIYVVGTFTEAGYVPNTKFIAMCDGTNWHALNNSYGELDSWAYRMTVSDNMLIVGGFFAAIGSTPFWYIAGYDEINYVHLGTGLPEIVNAIKEFNGELYAGGLWTSIKKYNTGLNQWEQVGGYLNYYTQDMVIDTINNFLYIGGGFNVVDDTIATDNIAIWDGFRWSKIGFGTGTISDVMAIEIYRGDVYAGLWTDSMGGVFTGYLARWDGQNWYMVGDSVGWAINDMVIFRDTLYIGGGVSIETYDTSRGILGKWYMPPDTTCKYLKPRVQTYEDTFYLSGGQVDVQFYHNNAYVQTWNWDFGDSGTASIKDPLHTYTDTGTYNVCVTVNDTGCIKTACKDIVVKNSTGINEINHKGTGFKLYPNPTSTELYIEITDKQLRITDISVYDVMGKVVIQTPVHPVIPNGSEESQETLHVVQSDKIIISVKTLPAGLYFVKVISAKGSIINKFVKE